jgi:copper homeostasis protein CutC
MPKIIKEACVETKEQLDNALSHHADQIELCSRLDIGGCAPTDELTQYALSKSDHILIMIRNRADYSTS